MEIRQLEYFITLCEELHFTRAAQKLHIAQPTLSHQIKVLEQEMGVLLFDRIGKKISLTEAGEVLYKQCLRIFQAIESTKDQLQELVSMQKGTLRIGALPGELTNLVSDSLLNYMKTYPFIQVSVLSTDDLYTMLKENKIDYAFSFAQNIETMYDNQFCEIPLYMEEFNYVTHQQDSLLEKEHISLTDLCDVPLVLFPKIHVCRNILDRVLKQEQLTLQAMFETSSINAIFDFVAQELGGTIVAKSLYKLHEQPNLVARPIQHDKLKRETVLIYRKDKFISQAVKAFIPIFLQYLSSLHIPVAEESQNQLTNLS